MIYDDYQNCIKDVYTTIDEGVPAIVINGAGIYDFDKNEDSNRDFYDDNKPTENLFDRYSYESYHNSLESKEGTGWSHYKITNADDFRKLAMLVEWDQVGTGGYPADVVDDIYDVYYQTYEKNGVDGRNHTITSMHMESAFESAFTGAKRLRLTQKNVLGKVTMENSEATGFTLSSGNWWIIGGASVVAIAAVVTLVVVTKKKKKSMQKSLFLHLFHNQFVHFLYP